MDGGQGHRNMDLESPISIYEAHIGSWRQHPGEETRGFIIIENSLEAVKYMKEMGYTALN